MDYRQKKYTVGSPDGEQQSLKAFQPIRVKPAAETRTLNSDDDPCKRRLEVVRENR